jgi:hypothetical protein
MPQKISLNGPYSESHVLVDGHVSADKVLDVSGKAKLSVENPKIAAVDDDGFVRPRSNGITALIVRVDRRTARVPIEVKGFTTYGPPHFLNDVIPVLTRAGCNQGACHGAGSGKGGFKLSLLGYDPDADYDAITRGSAARRIAKTQPENSLLLRKPALKVAHRGGLKLKAGSPEYLLIRDWIAGGMPTPDSKEARVVRLEVVPATRTLAVGQTQRFTVRAHYSDGSVRDATSQTLFNAGNESVAAVTPNGEAKATGQGEGPVVIRYQSLVTTARVISPFGTPRQTVAASGPAASKIDQLVMQKLGALGLETSPRSSDSDFLRRASLDATGQLPTPEEVRAFLADRTPQKRDRLIDSLLERPEYIDFWTMKWGDLLRSNRQSLSEKGMVAFNQWIRQSVATNKPWDQFAREILLAQGSTFEVGPANFYRTAGSPLELAETTSQVFLGVRIQCARCHNHPYEKWTQNQYYQMAAFFARVKRKPLSPTEPAILPGNSGEVTHPKTRKVVAPCALDATPVDKQFKGDRREALADWLTSPKNPFFAKIIVNRIWHHYMGRGLVEPVDDIRVTNPPSNEPLFNWLASDLVEHHYDLKYLMRTIMRSQAYQRAAEPVKGNERDASYYSHYLFKRLGAEQLIDALGASTGVPEKFAGFPIGTHAEQLPDTSVPSYFLDLFGRPARNVTCECERMDDPNLGQVLHLMNNAGINGKLSSKTGRVTSLMAAKLPDNKIVEDLYLASVSRYPSPDESKKGVKALATAKNKQQAAEDLMWALLNSKEYMFNH